MSSGIGVRAFVLEATVTGVVSVRMPRGAVVLDVTALPEAAGRGTLPCVHAVCDPGAPEEERAFMVVRTGDALPSDPPAWFAEGLRAGRLVGADPRSFGYVGRADALHVFQRLAEGGAR